MSWPSALLFSLIVIPSAMILCFQFEPLARDIRDPWILSVFAVMGSVLTPILVCHFLWPKMNQVLLMVVLYNIVLTALTAVLEGFASITQFKVDEFLAFLPGIPVILTALNADSSSVTDSLTWYLVGNVVVLAVVIGALLLGSLPYFREWNALFRSGRSLQSSTGITGPVQATL